MIASALGYAATVACYVLLIRTSLGRRFDRAAYLGVLGQTPASVRVNDTILHQITGYSLGLALIILVAIGVWRHRPLLGLAAAFAAGLTVVLAVLSKAHVFTTPAISSNPTFPSGHTAAAVACAMALLFVTPPASRGVAALIAGSYGWVTAAQVQVAGWHRVSDAIGAACLAFASVTAVAGLIAWLRPVDRDRRGTPKWAVTVLGAVALAAAALTAWGMVSVLGNLRHHPLGTESPAVRHDAYLTGIALTIGSSSCCCWC
jgi:membrane-associated phospholipid phosphatase